MNNSWIKLHRKFIESPIWKYSIAAKMPHLISLWCLILISANWEEKKWYNGREEIIIPKGSIITSLQHLADDAGITIRQVRVALQHYENMKMMTRKTTNKWTQVWIVNWDKYQMRDNSNNLPDDNPMTNGRQTDDNPMTTTKEYKNIRTKEYRDSALSSIEYLRHLPEDHVVEFNSTYKANPTMIREKAEALANYCDAHGKKYKNYRAMLQGSLLKDFGKRKAEVKFNPAEVAPEVSEEVRLANLKRSEEMRANFKFKTI